MSKLKIAVFFGGCSSEYGVSLQSAHAVISHMDPAKYDPVLIGITKYGDWYEYTGDLDSIVNDNWYNQFDCLPAVISPSRRLQGLIVFTPNGPRTERLDAAMPILHGKNGEDGTLQGLLELAGIPIVGCNTLSSALCMDKDRAHKLVQLAGIRVPQAFVLKKGQELATSVAAAESYGYPLFVKPVKAGSSYGVTKVMNMEELLPAIDMAFQYDDEVIIEENIPGFEVGCAVLGCDDPQVGELDEIELAEGFFDFEEKYNLITSNIHVPARIDPAKAAELKEAAKVIYKALGCSIFARVDMFLTPNGEIVFNEVNTIPGFTAHSRYATMFKAIGISFDQIIDTAIAMAVKK